MTQQDPSSPPTLGSSLDGSDANGGLRKITRRAGLPTGRAVVGGLLVTLAVIGLFLAYQSSQEDSTTPYLVMRQPVQAGERLERDDIALQYMELSDQLAERTFTEAQLDSVLGSVAAVDLLPGSLVQEASIFGLAEGEEPTADPIWELSISIPESRALAGTLRVGEYVDIIGTVDLDTGSDSFTCTFLTGSSVRVVQINKAGTGIGANSDNLVLLLAADSPFNVAWTSLSDDRTDMHLVRTAKANGEPLLGASTCGLDPRGLQAQQLADAPRLDTPAENNEPVESEGS